MTVAVEIHRVTLKRRRHELRRPERAGPGADQAVRRHVAALQDFQRRQKLLAEEIAAAADAGKRRGRADHRPIAAERAVVRFDAPDRRKNGAVDAVGAFDGGEGRRILRQQGAALRDAVVADEEVEIVPRRLGEFRLRIELVHDAEIRREPRGEALEICPGDAAPGGIRPHRRDAAAEMGSGGTNRVRRHQRIARRAGLPAPLHLVARGWNRTCRRGLKQARQPVVGLLRAGGAAERSRHIASPQQYGSRTWPGNQRMAMASQSRLMVAPSGHLLMYVESLIRLLIGVKRSSQRQGVIDAATWRISPSSPARIRQILDTHLGNKT